jgi:predicted outer membrane repeat protein
MLCKRCCAIKIRIRDIGKMNLSKLRPALLFAVFALSATSLALGKAVIRPGENFIIVGPSCVNKSLQDAIDTAAGHVGTILVQSTYNSGFVQIDGKTLHIDGSMASCDGVTHNGSLATLTGGASDVHALIGMSGAASLDLKNFKLTGGHNEGHNGGGISFASSGAKGHLELHNVIVEKSTSDRGGGIYFDGESSLDDFSMENTSVDKNFALKSGGGLRIQGGVSMTMDALSAISNNLANVCESDDPKMCSPNNIADGRGGGLQILDSASATLAGSIHNNEARYGGGIAMHDFATVTANNLIFSNAASHNGGAVFLAPSGDGTPEFTTLKSSITGNIAANGGAIYSDVAVLETAAVPIHLGPPIDTCFNGTVTIAENTTTQPGGATVLAQNGSNFDMFCTEIRNNSSDVVIQIFDDVEFNAANDLIVGNRGHDSPSPLQAVIDFAASDVVFPTISFITVADNSLSSTGSVIRGLISRLKLSHFLIWQPQNATFGTTATHTTQLSDGLMKDADKLSSINFAALFNVNTLTDPKFFNSAAGDYHLTLQSPAVDYSSNAFLNFFGSLNGKDRPLAIVRSNTAWDVGAYELESRCPATDNVFCDSFDFSKL